MDTSVLHHRHYPPVAAAQTPPAVAALRVEEVQWQRADGPLHLKVSPPPHPIMVRGKDIDYDSR